MSDPLEQAAKAYVDNLIIIAKSGSQQKRGWFADYEMEWAFKKGVAWRDKNPSEKTNRCAFQAQEMAKEIATKLDALEEKLTRISGMCGAPDAAEACRNILKIISGEHK